MPRVSEWGVSIAAAWIASSWQPDLSDWDLCRMNVSLPLPGPAPPPCYCPAALLTGAELCTFLGRQEGRLHPVREGSLMQLAAARVAEQLLAQDRPLAEASC